MAEDYSDSDSEECTGFTQADLGDENNYFIPDSEPDSDFSICTVHSIDISNLGEEILESGTDEIGEAEWTQNFGGITIDNFNSQSLACLEQKCFYCMLISTLVSKIQLKKSRYHQ